MKKLVVFDLDGTLAESKGALDAEMAELLYRLLAVTKVAIISGGDWPQFEKQLLSNLPHDDRLRDLSLLPTCGTKFLTYDGAWRKIYSEDFGADEKAEILSGLQTALADAGDTPQRVWGPTIEDRGSQITFSALGQAAPLEAKKEWDPQLVKRKRIKAILDISLPDYSVRIGGATSIDITKSGIDKAYGIMKLRDILGIELPDMLFIGDALFPDGNDYPVKAAGVCSIQVRDPQETKQVVSAVLACMEVPPESQPSTASPLAVCVEPAVV